MDINGKVLEKVREYISADESYDDDAQITIDPASLEVGLVDGEEADGMEWPEAESMAVTANTMVFKVLMF